MTEGSRVRTLEPQAFDIELQSGQGPCLVAFLKRNDRYRDQMKILEEASAAYGGVFRFYLFDADYLDTALERFKVKGTPTFLLFREGREVSRLIGESDRETLGEFIESALEMG
ncbi:thioredoxin [Pseudodesulfovibrio cashew]|uniref:Thioredoxin n=1 Tax=Pseudodesulfovibrio cashew TaxID=2678688 RepID=A0A6I6JLZ4_9BACT|nr:thioredoxin family protein [Pseudodesulfovibrio cashew]QGY38704.1 thioredoxin [Pseudodesulfovibrio cashew]